MNTIEDSSVFYHDGTDERPGWYWTDEKVRIGPFETKEEATKDAEICGWVYDESISTGLFGGEPPRDK